MIESFETLKFGPPDQPVTQSTNSRDNLTASGSRNDYVLTRSFPQLSHHQHVLAARGREPDFTATAVVDQEFKEISLSQYRSKYVVLFFYPWISPS